MELDIQPIRMTPIDIASMDEIERIAILVHLAGNPDPVIAGAVVDAARDVLARTRGGEQ